MALITTGYEPKHTPNQVNFLEGCIPDALFNQVKEAYAEYCEQNFKAVQKQVPLGYFETRQEAMICLAEYNKNPYDLKANKTTFEDVWLLIQPELQKLSYSANYSYKNAFKHTPELHKKRIADIVTNDMQMIVDKHNSSKGTQKEYINLFRKIFNYADMNGLVKKNYAEFLKVTCEESTKEKSPFTSEEIQKLWGLIDWEMPVIEGTVNRLSGQRLVDVLLILLYTGMRINELLTLECNDIDLGERIIHLHGTKTKNAERLVPIHKDILPLIEKRMKADSLLIRSKTGRKLAYTTFTNDFFNFFREQFNLNHTLHDTRHTFVTFAHICKIDEVLLKKMIGHSSQDLTFDTYTHAFSEHLIQEIDKLKFE